MIHVGEKIRLKRPKYLLLVGAGVLFLDQLTKTYLATSGSCLKNYDALFGLRADLSVSFFFLFAFVAGSYLLVRHRPDAARFASPLVLLLAGISGNALDRWRLGYILDCFSVSGAYAFNLADLAILSGSILFFWQIMKE